MKNNLPFSRRFRPFLPLTAATILTCLVALLLGFSQSLAAVGAATRYVDWATGSDDSDCTNPNDPCQTIGYAANQSGSGDSVLVAEGVYSETITINQPLDLLGGYEATGWSRDIAGNLTTIDGNGADSNVVNIVPFAGTFTLEGFTVQGGSPSFEGGGLLVNGATVVISATTITGNEADGSGGGIWYEGGAAVSLVNAVVMANSSNASGGGIAGVGDNLTLDNTEVRDNTAASEGGGIMVSDGSVSVTNSSVLSNTAAGGGGGFWMTNPAVLSVSGSTIAYNGSSNGGGFNLIGVSAVIDNATIEENQVNNDGWGGGLMLMGSQTVTLTNSTVLNNHAEHRGGGLAMCCDDNGGGNAFLESVLIQGNDVTGPSAFSGGGIGGFGTLVLRDSMVDGNSVLNTGGGENFGAAINLESPVSSVTIEKTIIQNNDSQGTPVIALYQNEITMINSLVMDNRGPGISGSPSDALFMNVTVADNDGPGLEIFGPGAGDPQFPVDVEVVNSILWGNGFIDYACDGGHPTVSCSLAYSDVENGDTAGTGNISADPLFLDPSNGDYHLSIGSPAIDAGTAANAPADDLEGSARDGLPDMGAYEWAGFRIYLPIALKG
jgi:hypothetical protein